MKSVAVLPALLAGACAVWMGATAVRMGAWLSAHGVKVNWFLYRATFPWHVDRYRRMTAEIEGRPGPLYREFQLAIVLTVAFALVTILALLA